MHQNLTHRPRSTLVLGVGHSKILEAIFGPDRTAEGIADRVRRHDLHHRVAHVRAFSGVEAVARGFHG